MIHLHCDEILCVFHQIVRDIDPYGMTIRRSGDQLSVHPDVAAGIQGFHIEKSAFKLADFHCLA